MLPFQQKTLILEIVLGYVTFSNKKTLMLEIVPDYVTFPTKDIDVRNCTRLCYLSNKKK